MIIGKITGKVNCVTKANKLPVLASMRRVVASTTMLSMVFASALSLSAPVYAASEDEPGAFEMTADALVARPLGIALTTLGAAAFVVSLPFSAIGGNVKEAADQLVVGPGKNTFVRCLGCKVSGRKAKTRE